MLSLTDLRENQEWSLGRHSFCTNNCYSGEHRENNKHLYHKNKLPLWNIKTTEI